MSLTEILKAGNMPPRLAVMFWLAMERGASIIVAADPPSAGKTATLTALLSLTPPDTVVYFTRGIGETFDLPPGNDRYPTYILVNEMSDHLPVYTWDSYARRAFELLAEGYSLATTVHADTVEEVLTILREDIGVPPEHIARLTFIVPLAVSPGTGGVHRPPPPGAKRRVAEAAFFQPDGASGYTSRSLARWDEATDSFAVLETENDRRAFAEWCGLPPEALAAEMHRREAFLNALLENDTASIPEVNAAIERFYEEEIRPRRSA